MDRQITASDTATPTTILTINGLSSTLKPDELVDGADDLTADGGVVACFSVVGGGVVAGSSTVGDGVVTGFS